MHYRFVGNHPDELEGGRPVEPGEIVEVDDIESPKNKAMIEDGLLIEAAAPQQEEAPQTLEPAQAETTSEGGVS